MDKNKEIRMNRRLSQEEFLQRLNKYNIKIKPLDPYTRLFDNIRWQCDKYKDHIWYTSPANVLKKNGTRCPYCSGNKVLKGFNDLWTTHPEIATHLVDKDIGYEISHGTNAKQDFVCPQCGNLIKNARIKDIIRYGFKCSCCSDGISFPERFVSNFLRQLKKNYKHDTSFDWSENKRYDFYIKELNLIIETHGEQHYHKDKQWHGSTIEQEQINDKYKKDIALSNGIEYYVVLDCRESDADFIKSSILNSELTELFDLSLVDWQKCSIDSCKSNIVMACDLWNSGMHSTKEISEIMCLTRTTVISYLNKGSKYGFCDYDGKQQMQLSMLKNTRNKNIA